MFGGKEFEWVDEFYHFYADGPYSRERLHVLLSIDVGKSDMSRWGSFARGSRPDNDYGLSWIQSYGKGRVFYTALGHTPELFMNPPLAAHMLAGSNTCSEICLPTRHPAPSWPRRRRTNRLPVQGRAWEASLALGVVSLARSPRANWMPARMCSTSEGVINAVGLCPSEQ